MAISLDWLGTATFRLTVDGLVLFLDAYMDRVSAAKPVGLSTNQVERADYLLIGHSHFDHLWGAERIARNTGATVIGSHETVRLMDTEEVPETQLVAVAGGERIRLSDTVSVRVFPSQHSCIWATAGAPDEACFGELGMTLQEREAALTVRSAGRAASQQPGMESVRAHLRSSDQRPRGEGGALAYLIETAEGSIFWNDTSGHWTGILRDLRPDAAILAAAGRGNVDGEPIQGTLAQFVVREADLLRPQRIILCHHDNWMPPFTGETDLTPIREAMGRYAPRTELVELEYMDGYPLLQGMH
jgi:L-ascorbate metabolism protein UlaG (beta-lactamase superfamily)